MSDSKTYDIKRFWTPIDKKFDLSDGGYLEDPEQYPEWMGHAESVGYEYLQDVPCLILLGEPGAGKSTWFDQICEQLSASIRANGDEILPIRLQKAHDVRDEVFESEEFLDWRKGRHRLYLFFDGFDEREKLDRWLRNLIAKVLESAPLERLCFRVVCRTFSIVSEQGRS